MRNYEYIRMPTDMIRLWSVYCIRIFQLVYISCEEKCEGVLSKEKFGFNIVLLTALLGSMTVVLEYFKSFTDNLLLLGCALFLYFPLALPFIIYAKVSWFCYWHYKYLLVPLNCNIIAARYRKLYMYLLYSRALTQVGEQSLLCKTFSTENELVRNSVLQ